MSETSTSIERTAEDAHPCNCVCDSCWQIDVANIIAAHPHGTWTPDRLEWIRGLRKRPLNWALEPGHCALCGGTSLAAGVTYEHFEVRPYNPVVQGGVTYLSWLLANDSGYHAAYVAASKKGKDFLRQWSSRCITEGPIVKDAERIAVREVDRGGERWTEIRVGFNA